MPKPFPQIHFVGLAPRITGTFCQPCFELLFDFSILAISMNIDSIKFKYIYMDISQTYIHTQAFHSTCKRTSKRIYWMKFILSRTWVTSNYQLLGTSNRHNYDSLINNLSTFQDDHITQNQCDISCIPSSKSKLAFTTMQW